MGTPDEWADWDAAEIHAGHAAYLAEYGPDVEADQRRTALCDAADHLHQTLIGLKTVDAPDACLAVDQALVAVVRELAGDERMFRTVYTGMVSIGYAAAWSLEQATWDTP